MICNMLPFKSLHFKPTAIPRHSMIHLSCPLPKTEFTERDHYDTFFRTGEISRQIQHPAYWEHLHDKWSEYWCSASYFTDFNMYCMFV